jgi:orotate phosphoribosyltransferase
MCNNTIDGLQYCGANFRMLAAEPPRYWVSMHYVPQPIDVKSPSLEATELLAILAEKSVCHGNFTLASGAQSDLYVDAKLTTSDPRAALLVGRVGWELIKQTAKARNVRVDSVGGLTMGADWMALSIGIAAHLDNPEADIKTFSVRKSAKEHGRHKLIEGNFSKGDSVVVVEDVITKGGSTLQAIEAIEQAEGEVVFVLVLVDRQEGGRQAIEQRGHLVVPIFTRADLIGADCRPTIV